MSAEFSKSFQPSKRRGTPIPVAPPRVPTPMPLGNNNNATRTSQARDVHTRAHLSSAGQDTPQLITKAAYKLLDNDVKTAWINPRLISKKMYYESSKIAGSSGQVQEVGDEKSASPATEPSSSENDPVGNFEKKINNVTLRKNTMFQEKFSLPGRTYGTTTFEQFAKEGSPRYQDLWLRNPRDPFAVSSVHSMSHNISDMMEYENLKKKLSSCLNLSNKTSGQFNKVLSEAKKDNFKKCGSLSNNASASSSEHKLSDISTPKHSSEYLEGDGSGLKYNKRYDIEQPKTSDFPYPTNMFANTNNIPDSSQGKEFPFKNAKRIIEEEKSSDCLEYIRKCIEDLDM